MFSVRLPSLSTRHEGPPGARGQASHAAGTRAIRGREVALSCTLPYFTPIGFAPPPPSLSLYQAPALCPICTHRASPKTQAHPGPRLRTPARHSQRSSSYARASANSSWALSPERILAHGARALTGFHSHTPQTLRSGPPSPNPRRCTRARQLTGLAGGQLQLRLVGAGAVGPGAEHLAADGLLAHQRGRAVRVPQARVAGAPAAPRLQQLLLGRAPQGRPDSGPPGHSPSHGNPAPAPLTSKPSPVPRSPAHSLAGVLHTPLPPDPSAGSRRKETSALTFCESWSRLKGSRTRPGRGPGPDSGFRGSSPTVPGHGSGHARSSGCCRR